MGLVLAMTSSPVDLTVLIAKVISAYAPWLTILGTVVGMAVGKEVVPPGKLRSLGASTTIATRRVGVNTIRTCIKTHAFSFEGRGGSGLLCHYRLGF